MKYQSLISKKKKKKKKKRKEKYFKMLYAENLPSMLSNSPTILHYRIDLKYWDALAIFIASPRIYNCPCPVCWCVSGLSAGLCDGRCSPSSDAAFCYGLSVLILIVLSTSLGKTFLLGVLFEVTLFCSDWPYLVRKHLSVLSQVFTLKLNLRLKLGLT